ncbi:MAG: hypothetical protein HYX63_10035 [Gammaproteobacteria bacterium]|nr:hypothetical protein [Gammaproteobacteria bacterium]
MKGAKHDADDPNLLLTALMFLQVQFVQQQRLPIAFAIEDHLRRLDRIGQQLPPLLAHALPRLREQWRKHVLERSIRATAEAVAHACPTSAVVIPFPLTRLRS